MNLKYEPAQLREGKRWFVSFYQTDPVSGKKQRFQRSYQLNRIRDLVLRKDQALRIVQKINAQLPFGYPFIKKTAALDYTILEGFKVGLKQKMLNPNKATTNSYRSHGHKFIDWLIDTKLGSINLADFSRRHAMLYLNHILTTKTIRPTTYNNKVQFLKSIFYELVDQEILKNNPFAKIKKKKTGKKLRRSFTIQESKIMGDYIYKDQPLFVATLLLYHCMIRPTELRKLRASNISLEYGVIFLNPEDTKNGKGGLVTIPDVDLSYLRNSFLKDIPDNHFVWGPRLQPHPTQMCGKNAMNIQHHKYLKELFDSGKLKTIKGLTFYSWKDTGGRDILKENVNVHSLRDHFRHSTLDTTNVYIEKRVTRDPEIAKIKSTIIPQKQRELPKELPSPQ